MRAELTPGRVRAVRAIALVADGVQLGLLPLFVQGWLSPINNVLDVVVAIAMLALAGWHWAFLPAFVSELVPVLGLVPTWTAAALIATRGRGAPGPPDEVLPPGLPPAEKAPPEVPSP